ncbi:MAG TPA: hypothetical protein VGI63_03610 [Verrucomicrobiae bacterium]|jgi:hypothetical protein
MDSNEREVFNYLQTWGGEFVGAKEICRRASSKKRYQEDPDWAKAILQVMTERGVLERDVAGRYRVKPKSKKGHGGRWVSPDIAELLKEKGLDGGTDAAGASPVDDSE